MPSDDHIDGSIHHQPVPSDAGRLKLDHHPELEKEENVVNGIVLERHHEALM